MNGLIRKAALTACGLAVAATAFAGVPSPGNSSTPGCFRLVPADLSGAPNPSGTFQVTVRDLANNPIGNSTVVIDFVNCGNADVRMQSGQAHDVAMTQNCAARTVRKSTDVTGNVSFLIVGGGSSSGGAGFPFFTNGCARIFADGVLLATVGVAVYDQNGGAAGGSAVGPADVSAVITDAFITTPDRADINCSGGAAPVSPADVAELIALSFSTYNQPLSGVFCNL